MHNPGIRVFLLKAMRMPGLLFVLSALLFSCSGPVEQNNAQEPQTAPQAGQSISKVGAIPLPEGYIRIKAAEGSYPSFLRNITLKKDPTVYLYNGTKKRNQQAQYAVLDIDAGNKDLQQCADAVMRLRAEYLFARKQYASIAFRFTNGFNCDYPHYANGYRLSRNGNNCSWVKQKGEDYSHATFRNYLDLVYAYAGTKSLYAQLEPLPFARIAPGKVLIQTRNPYGHAVTVMDMACNPNTRDTIFLLAQSYMPAQDIHILRNPGNTQLSPWYSTHFEGNLETPEWTFYKEDLREF